MMHFMQLAELWNSALELCYPPACLRCGENSDCELCAACSNQFRAVLDRCRCGFCARPVVAGADCPYCKAKGAYPFKRIAALGVFDHALKDLIHAMKYHRRWGIGEYLAESVAESWQARQILQQADVLVPVPLWRWRQVGRGYNQAGVVACRLARKLGKSVESAVIRTRRTASQTELRSGESRRENVRDAFKLRLSSKIAGKRVVVIDDVMTSGATIKEVGRVLLQAEPADLSALVLAVADPRGRGFQAI